jgi:hypothetical protein
MSKTVVFLDFKLSPCSECCVLSFGRFPSIIILYAYIPEHSVCSINIGGVYLFYLLTECLFNKKTSNFRNNMALKIGTWMFGEYIKIWKGMGLFYFSQGTMPEYT